MTSANRNRTRLLLLAVGIYLLGFLGGMVIPHRCKPSNSASVFRPCIDDVDYVQLFNYHFLMMTESCYFLQLETEKFGLGEHSKFKGGRVSPGYGILSMALGELDSLVAQKGIMFFIDGNTGRGDETYKQIARALDFYDGDMPTCCEVSQEVKSHFPHIREAVQQNSKEVITE